MTDNLRKILETNRHIKHRIQTLTNDFSNVQLDFMNELQEIPKTNLEDELDFFNNFSLILDNQFTFDEIQLAVCGPNNSGKTSFLHNFLKIGAILPATAGPVTARIVKLTYASAQNACLNVYSSINAGLSQKQPDTQIYLSKFFEQENNPNWVGIRNEISIHLERPNNLSEEEFTNWAKHFIEIQIPSPTLELGIDVYDTPGFLFHDKLVTKENLYELVKLVKPTLIFMYENSTFPDDAHECFLALQSTIGDLEYSSIFFLNTKQDITTIFDGAGINVSQRHLFTEKNFYEILPKERKKRLKLLLDVPIMRSYLHQNDDLCENFDICSLPKPRSILPQCATQMTESAILHIIQFTVKTDLERPFNIADKILNSIDSFFQFSLTTSHRDPNQWKKICNDAKSWGETFFKKFQEEKAVPVDIAYRNILRYFDQCSANICKRAVKRERINDPLESKTQQITKSNIKQFIEIAVQEEVIKVAVNEIINKTKDALRLSITHEIAINLDNNELLLAAQRQVLIDISATELEQRTWLESILLNISMVPTTISRMVKGIRTQWDIEYWNKTKLEDFQTKEEYDAYNEALDSYEVLLNPDKRKDFAESYLEKMKINIQEQETLFKRNLKGWIENRKNIFFENIQSNYYLAIKHLSARKSAYEKTNLYAGRFARIQCQLLAIKNLQKFNGQLPIIDTSITLGQGAFFIIHPAEWGEQKNLVVKKLKQPLLDYPNLQYIEAYYHQKITKLSIPHIVPLLYLFSNPNDENDLWIFLPRYVQSLDEYLEVNIRTIKPDEIIRIVLDIANVLLKLHSHEIVHRDLKSKNILLDENNQCYLADFGTCKQTALNETIVGTYPLAPEVLLSRHDSILNYNGMAVDIYSFGILLYELLPKLKYHRPYYNQNNIDIKDLLKNVSPFDINNNDYEMLIESCLAKKFEQRPTALQLVQKLEAIKKKLEEKLCTICETHVRKCRCYPCGHKLLCKICYNQLNKNSQNKVECILCRQIVEKWEEDNYDQTFYLKT
jgi:serine/threonine protein kinase